MKPEKIPKQGTTLTRKDFWDTVLDIVGTQKKVEGRNVKVNEFDGYGTIISVVRERGGVATATGACCVGTDCSIQTVSDCTNMGGSYQGDGTPCIPNPCLPGGCPDPGCPPLSVSASVTFTVNDTESSGCTFHASATESLFSDTISDICATGGAWGPFEFDYPAYDNGQIFINSISVGLIGSNVCIGTDGVCGVFFDCDEHGTCCGSGYTCFYIGDSYMTSGTACSSGCGGSTTFTWVLDDGMGFSISASLTVTIG